MNCPSMLSTKKLQNTVSWFIFVRAIPECGNVGGDLTECVQDFMHDDVLVVAVASYRHTGWTCFPVLTTDT